MNVEIPPAASFVEAPGARVGLISDSHGKRARTRAGLTLLLREGAESILHLGDLCDDGILDELVGLQRGDGRPAPARALLGNMDQDERGTMRYAAAIGVAVDHPAGFLRVAGKRIVAHHGHLDGFDRAAVDAGAEYYVHGHTHWARDERESGCRLINPGAVQRAPMHTCALLDCRSDDLIFFEIETGRRVSVREAVGA